MSILSNLLVDLFATKKASNHAAVDVTESVENSIEIIKDLFETNDLAGAQEKCKKTLTVHPNNLELQQLQSDIEFLKWSEYIKDKFPGPRYLEWLEWFHGKLQPASYLEIGVESGQSLQFAMPPTLAVGVDPAIRIVHSQENWVKLFKLTSDDFFAQHDPKKVFGKNAIDFAFIDGLHTFDQALKDFINTEKYSTTQSVVLFHDIFPVISETANRERTTKFWVGDTWKVMLILLKHRPDLKIFTIPTYPSGLGVVTNLDPNSTLLQDKFDDILKEAFAMEYDAFPGGIGNNLSLVENDFEVVSRLLNLH